jgi:hypothetical protein
MHRMQIFHHGVLTHVVQYVVVELLPTKLHGNLGPMGGGRGSFASDHQATH